MLSRSANEARTWLYDVVVTPQGLGTLFATTQHSRALWQWHKQTVKLLESIKKEAGRTHEHYVLDYTHKRIAATYAQQTRHYDFPAGPILDQHTLFIKLLTDLRRNKNPSGTYHIISRGKLRTYHIYDRGYARLKSDKQKRLLRVLEREKKGQLSERYWLNPAYNYLPLQIEKWRERRLQHLIRVQKIIQG